MSLYREAERQRKRRRQRERGGGKKSSLGAALSASLTALFTGGKDLAAAHGDCDYYYGAVNAADRVEYVTVRGCRPERDGDDDSSGGELSSGDENHGYIDADDISTNGNAYDRTKGLAQMAVALGKSKILFPYVSHTVRIVVVKCRSNFKKKLLQTEP